MGSKKTYGSRFETFLDAITVQVSAFQQRERSRIEQNYSRAMEASAAAVVEFARNASFEELLEAERTFQKNDLAVYAKRPSTVKGVQEGIDDLEAGMGVYRQLVGDTAAYKAHTYRKKEMLPPENAIPLDAMRRALRGQMKRVENYRANVMGNAHEQEFLSARIALLRRAETLYDEMQKERLTPPEGTP